MGKFGSSYPPGCSGPPGDDAPMPSKLVGDVLGLLEEAGCPTEVNDQVVKLIEGWEHGLAEPEGEPYIPEPPAIEPGMTARVFWDFDDTRPFDEGQEYAEVIAEADTPRARTLFRTGWHQDPHSAIKEAKDWMRLNNIERA